MMEFILSKAVVCVLGVVLMGTALSFMEYVEDDRETDGLQNLSDGIATILDRFWHSDIDTMTIPQSAVPFTDCVITVEDNLNTVLIFSYSAGTVPKTLRSLLSFQAFLTPCTTDISIPSTKNIASLPLCGKTTLQTALPLIHSRNI